MPPLLRKRQNQNVGTTPPILLQLKTSSRRNRNRNVKKTITAVAKTDVVVTSKTKILNLNDDCLREVFNYLSPFDMCAVKDSCRTFRELAENRMKQFYKSNEMVLSDPTVIEENNDQMKEFVKFGKFVKKLRAETVTDTDINLTGVNLKAENESIILSTIQKYNTKLDALTLTGSNFEPALRRLGRILPKLRKVSLEYFDANRFESDVACEEVIKRFFENCKNAEEICFGSKACRLYSRVNGIFLQQNLKKLHSIVLHDIRVQVNNLISFLHFNPNLKRIVLKRCVTLRDFININFQQNSPNIEGISVEFDHFDHSEQCKQLSGVDGIYQLNQLKHLAFDTGSKGIVNFVTKLAQNNSLNFLALTNVYDKYNDGLAKAFRNMTNLKTLRLHINFYAGCEDSCNEFYKNLAINLVNLVELHVLHTKLTYRTVRDIIENSTKLEKLYLVPITEDVFNEENYEELVATRLCRTNVCQLTIFIDEVKYFFTLKLISHEILTKNNRIIKLAKFNPLDFDDHWIPYSN